MLCVQRGGHLRVYTTAPLASSAGVAFRSAVSGATTQAIAIAAASTRAVYNVLLQSSVMEQCT